jgi:hypothetical protein
VPQHGADPGRTHCDQDSHDEAKATAAISHTRRDGHYYRKKAEQSGFENDTGKGDSARTDHEGLIDGHVRTVWVDRCRVRICRCRGAAQRGYAADSAWTGTVRGWQADDVPLTARR